MHQPLVQAPTSTIAPFGMSVTISLSVPGLFRRLTSATTVAVLAAAILVVSAVAIATLPASRARFINPSMRTAPHAALNQVRAAIQWFYRTQQDLAGKLVFSRVSLHRLSDQRGPYGAFLA